MKESVYLETTVLSYRMARPNRDVIVLAHQQITNDWWDRCIDQYDVFVSELVREEASEGDPDAAKRRLEMIERFQLLDITPEAERLAELYWKRIPILRDAIRDASHLAIASSTGVDYLVTWNCKHIARAEVRKAIEAINDGEGIGTPTICTPEELLGE